MAVDHAVEDNDGTAPVEGTAPDAVKEVEEEDMGHVAVIVQDGGQAVEGGVAHGGVEDAPPRFELHPRQVAGAGGEGERPPRVHISLLSRNSLSICHFYMV